MQAPAKPARALSGSNRVRACATVVVGAIWSMAVGAVRAEVEAPLPSVEDFFRLPEVAIERLSPSGRYLAILGRSEAGRLRLAIIDLTTPDKQEKRFSYQGADIRSFHWVNDKRLVFDIWDSTGEQENTGNGGLFAIDWDSTNFVPLIAAYYGFKQDQVGSHMRSKILSTNHSYFSSLHNSSDDIIVFERRSSGKERLRNWQRVLHRLNTRTRELSDMTVGQPEGTVKWFLDGDGVPQAAEAYVEDRRIVYGRSKDSKGWDALGDFNVYTSVEFVPKFLGFDGALYAAHQSLDLLYRYDPGQRRFDDEPVVKIPGFDVIDGSGPEVDYSARKVVGFHYLTDARGTVWLDPRFSGYQKKVDATFPKASNYITCGDCLSSKFLLVESSTDRQPIQYLVFDVSAEKLLRVGSQRPAIRPGQMGTRDFVHYPAGDGLSIPAYVTVPPDRYAKPYPMVVLVHDWPIGRQTSWEWDQQAQFLASHGYAVIQPEYRGSSGFGFEHFKAGWRQLGLAMQDDLADAARWAVAQGIADPDRIAIAGRGIGGYASLMGLIRNPEIFKCAFEWAGVTDLNLIYSATWSDISEQYLELGAPILIGDPVKDAEQLKATSPLENAQRITQPVLLAYGGRDSRVPLTHGEKLHSAIATPKDRVEWVVYPKQTHAWNVEKDAIDFWTRVDKFLEKNLKSLPHANP